jgi:hypothetical protein
MSEICHILRRLQVYFPRVSVTCLGQLLNSRVAVWKQLHLNQWPIKAGPQTFSGEPCYFFLVMNLSNTVTAKHEL